jgi:hypothetical protein
MARDHNGGEYGEPCVVRTGELLQVGTINKEVEVQVADVSAAIIAAASLKWPRRRSDCAFLTVRAAKSLAARRPIADGARERPAAQNII